jgi:hypothetical protein
VVGIEKVGGVAQPLDLDRARPRRGRLANVTRREGKGGGGWRGRRGAVVAAAVVAATVDAAALRALRSSCSRNEGVVLLRIPATTAAISLAIRLAVLAVVVGRRRQRLRAPPFRRRLVRTAVLVDKRLLVVIAARAHLENLGLGSTDCMLSFLRRRPRCPRPLLHRVDDEANVEPKIRCDLVLDLPHVDGSAAFLAQAHRHLGLGDGAHVECLGGITEHVVGEERGE